MKLDLNRKVSAADTLLMHYAKILNFFVSYSKY